MTILLRLGCLLYHTVFHVGIFLRQYDRDCFPGIGEHSEHTLTTEFSTYVCGEEILWLLIG